MYIYNLYIYNIYTYIYIYIYIYPPDVFWEHLNGMSTQKMCPMKWNIAQMKDSLRILKNILFKNHKYHGTSNSIKHQIFLDTQLATIIGGFWISDALTDWAIRPWVQLALRVQLSICRFINIYYIHGCYEQWCNRLSAATCFFYY